MAKRKRATLEVEVWWIHCMGCKRQQPCLGNALPELFAHRMVNRLCAWCCQPLVSSPIILCGPHAPLLIDQLDKLGLFLTAPDIGLAARCEGAESYANQAT